MKNKNLRADIWLFIATAVYFIMNGAQLWETAIMVPAWTAAPPESLFFFKGTYGLDFKYFWIIVHSIHEIILLAALVFNWQFRTRRNLMLILLLFHIGIRIWTLQYFAPTIIEFQAMEVTPMIDSTLVERAAHWRNLNYLRVGIFFLINIGYATLFFLKPQKVTNDK
ncbi:MAG TPA: hypothetical protein PKC76_10525 [Saprospiraceae bacterium]|nr:hypothetical protein [Saprospiraceae bacterium]HMP24558.1 hypothetical protein [Saprospiraceae bacterium]